MIPIRFRHIDIAAKIAFAIASFVALKYFFTYHYSASGHRTALSSAAAGVDLEGLKIDEDAGADQSRVPYLFPHQSSSVKGPGPGETGKKLRSVYERECPKGTYPRGYVTSGADGAENEDDGLRDLEPELASDYLFMLPRPKRIIYGDFGKTGAPKYLVPAARLKVSVYCDNSLCPASVSQHKLKGKRTASMDIDRSLSEPAINAFMDTQWPLFCKQQRSIRKSEGINPSTDVFYVQNINVVIEHDHLFNESDSIAAYKLHVDPSGVVDVHVTSTEGARYALATLSQLLSQPGTVRLPLDVHDWPARPWRGMLVDVARHYLPIKALERVLDTMQALKMNVLHLHLTDSQSFPVLLRDTKSYNLSQFAIRGSFRPDQVYTLQQLKALVAYAAERGIEIVPEIDVPAHTRAWDRGFPGIVVQCPRTVAIRGGGAASSTDIPALDISHPHVIPIIREVLTQVASVFPSRYLHVGGDEVIPECWSESKAMLSLRNSSGGKSWNQLLLAFEEKIFAEVRRLHKIPIVWQGIVDSGSMPSEEEGWIDGSSNKSSGVESHPGASRAIVQPWKCWSNMDVNAARSAARLGHKVISAACLYLDWDVDWENYFATESLVAAEAAANSYPIGGTKRNTAADNFGSSTASRASTIARYNSSISPSIGAKATSRLLRSSPKETEIDFSGETLKLYRIAKLHAAEKSVDGTGLKVIADRRRRLELLDATSISRPDPVTGLTPTFLGGEGAMWTERVDHSNLECRLWPRGAVVASVLWGFYNDDPVSPDVIAIQSLRKKSSNNFRFSRGDSFDASEESKVARSKINLLASYLFLEQFLLNHMGIFVPKDIIVHQDDSNECSGGRKNSGATGAIPRTKHFTPIRFQSISRLVGYLTSEMTCVLSRNLTYSLPKVTSQCPMVPAHFRAPLVPAVFKNGDSVYSRTSAHGGSESRSVAPPLSARDFVYISLKASLLNINNGGGSRIDDLKKWFAERALLGDLFIGICEANDWHQLKGSGERKFNYENVVFYASDSGFVHSYVLSSPDHPFNLAMISRLPFKVVAAYRPPILLRGLLHVYFEVLDLHVFVAHLTPQSSAKRREEAGFVKGIIKPLIDKGDRVILMGDLNTFSRVDDAVLYQPGAPVCVNELTEPVSQDTSHRNSDRSTSSPLTNTAVHNHFNPNNHFAKRMERLCARQGGNATYIGFLNMITQSDHHVFVRYRKKYCIEAPQSSDTSSLVGGHKSISIDYQPFDILSSAGLRDACEASCSTDGGQREDDYATNERDGFTSRAFLQCMKSRCGNSEPTHYDPEWPEDILKSPAPFVRVDYILLSDSIVKGILIYNAEKSDNKKQRTGGFANGSPESRVRGRQDSDPAPGTLRSSEEPSLDSGPSGTASPAYYTSAPALFASVLKSNSTNILSDHYPVHVSFILKSPGEFWRR